MPIARKYILLQNLTFLDVNLHQCGIDEKTIVDLNVKNNVFNSKMNGIIFLTQKMY